MAFHIIVSIFPINLCWLSNTKFLGVDGLLMINNKLFILICFVGFEVKKCTHNQLAH
jgi:hypothetical protein